MDERVTAVTARARHFPLRRLFRREKVLGFVDEPMLSVYRERGVILKDERSNPNQTAEDRSIYQLVEPGWLVVNRMKAWQGSIGISTLRGIVSGHYICFAPMHEEHGRYLNWLLRSAPYTAHFAAISRGVRPGQIEIDNDELESTRVALPPVRDQRRIADFLDDQVARIDNIIAARAQQRMLVTECSVSEVDHYWRSLATLYGTARLGYLLSGVEQGWSPDAEARAAQSDEWAVMRAGCVNGGSFDEGDHKALGAETEPRQQYEIYAGDLLMSRASGSLDLIGSAAIVPEGVRPRLLLPDKVYRLFPYKPRVSAAFLAPMLRSPAARHHIRGGVSGAEGMANNIPAPVVRSIPVPALPLAQQPATIERMLALESQRSGTIISLQASVALLQEFKDSLITAAVTGEFDVSSADGSRVAV